MSDMVLDMETDLTQEQLAELGRRHLVEKELRELGERYNQARADVKAHSAALQASVKAQEGQMSEVELAKVAGVDRMTIRTWLGKRVANPGRKRGSTDERLASTED